MKQSENQRLRDEHRRLCDALYAYALNDPNPALTNRSRMTAINLLTEIKAMQKCAERNPGTEPEA